MFRLTIILVLAMIFNSIASPSAIGATVVVNKCYININGRIDRTSPRQLESAIQTLKTQKACGEQKNLAGILGTVRVSGPGGDVEAAIAMGIAIRRDQLDTWAAGEATCASSCVLVFLGGVSRAAFGQIGLHRPFSPEPSDSIEAAQAKFEKVNRLLTSYLTKMNIPLRLLDVMNSVPPSEIRLLNPHLDADEQLLKDLFITGLDPVFEDMMATKMAKMIGISKLEYIERMQRAQTECYATDARGRYIVKDPSDCSSEITVTGKRKQ